MESDFNVADDPELDLCNKKVHPHQGIVSIPGFHHLMRDQKMVCMHYVACICRLNGHWSEVPLADSNREDYCAYLCHNCKRIIVVDPYISTVTGT